MDNRNMFTIRDDLLISYNGPGGEVVVPDGIKMICNRAFMYTTTVEKVILPEGLTRIMEKAFYGSGVKSIVLPKSLSIINESAFQNSGLEEVSIPDGAIYAENVFRGAKHLKKVRLPNDFPRIEPGTFMNCSALEEIGIPECVKYIEAESFKNCKNLRAIRLPEGLISVWYSAFEGCSSLEEVRLPDDLEALGYAAFAGCTALKHVYVPAKIKTCERKVFDNDPAVSLSGPSIKNGMICADKHILYCPDSLKDVRIPEGIETTWEVFRSRHQLETVEFSDPLGFLSSCTFSDCINLREIRNLCCQKVENGAFLGCSSLKSLCFQPGLVRLDSNALKGLSALETLELPDSLRAFSWDGFETLTSLRTIIGGPESNARQIAYILGADFVDRSDPERKLPYVPMYADSGGEWFFEPDPENNGVCLTGYSGKIGRTDDHRVTGMILPNELNGLPVTSIGPMAFAGEGLFDAVRIPDSVVSIGEKAFSGESELTYVHIPERLRSVGAGAFDGTRIVKKQRKILDALGAQIREETFHDPRAYAEPVEGTVKTNDKDPEPISVPKDPYLGKGAAGYERLTEKIWKYYDSLNDEERKKALSHHFSITAQNNGHGRAGVNVELDEERAGFSISDVGYSIDEVKNDLMQIRHGQLKERGWSGEQAYYPWVIQRRAGILYVDAPKTSDGFFITVERFQKAWEDVSGSW